MKFNNIYGGMVTYPAGATFGPRVLDDYEFVYIHKGDIQWVINGRSIDVVAGDLVLVGPGTEDYIIWDTGGSTTHSFVHFSCSEEELPAVVPLKVSSGEGGLLEMLMRQIVYLDSICIDDGPPVLQSALNHLFECFLAGEVSVGEVSSEQLPYPVERVFEFLRTFWQENKFSDPGIEQVSRAAGVTPVHLNRLFRQYFGKTPGYVIRSLRMAHAAELLLRSNYQIQEIAEFAGSADPYHFSKQFKSIYGISPRAYRQRKIMSRPLAIAPLYKQFMGRVGPS